MAAANAVGVSGSGSRDMVLEGAGTSSRGMEGYDSRIDFWVHLFFFVVRQRHTFYESLVYLAR